MTTCFARKGASTTMVMRATNILTRFTTWNMRTDARNSIFYRYPMLAHPCYMSTKTSPSSQLSQLVKELRNRTGAPMIECKKALTADGVNEDIDKATDWLRKYGSAKAVSKLAGRETKEGLIGLAISADASRAAICQVACETDFSARSSSFIDLVQNVVLSALYSSSSTNLSIDVDALLQSPLQSSNNIVSPISTSNVRLVKELLDETVLAIRENLHIVQASSVQSPSPQAVINGYIHGKLSANTGTCAALVTLLPIPTCTLSREAILEVGKKLAMHVVAAKPIYLSPMEIPQDVVAKEREVIVEQMNQSSDNGQAAQGAKKKDIVDKIILGKMNKFQEQVCLTEQAHLVENGNPKVSKYLQGLGLKVVAFYALSVH